MSFLDGLKGAFTGAVEGLRKAQASAPLPTAQPAPPAGIFTDPDLLLRSISGEHIERPSVVGWDTLRAAANTPPLLAIIGTRCNQVAEFATPRSSASPLPGFRVRLREAEKSPSPAARKRIAELTRFVATCGVPTDDPDEALAREDLETLFRKGVRDAMRFDQVTWQVLHTEGRGRLGGRDVPLGIVAMPAHSIRIALPPSDGRHWTTRPADHAAFVQVDANELPVASFARRELVFGVRNPRSDLEVAGYGYSEVEQLLDVLTGWLWGYGYNKAFFRQGANIKGILNYGTKAEETPSAEMIRQFKHDFQQMISGVQNAHRVPILFGADAKWLSLAQNNKDMEFNAWMDFLLKLFCAICQMDPAELNFVYGNTGQSAAMGTADAETKMALSRDRGLRPMVKSFFNWLNRWVIWQLDEDFEVVPTGIDAKTEEAKVELQKKQVESYRTVDEIRAEEDMPPMPDGAGAVILHPTWLQALQGKQAQAATPEDGEADAGDGEDVAGELFGDEDDEEDGNGSEA